MLPCKSVESFLYVIYNAIKNWKRMSIDCMQIYGKFSIANEDGGYVSCDVHFGQLMSWSVDNRK